MKISDRKVDLALINGMESADGGGVSLGNELMHFSEAIAKRDEESIRSSREVLSEVAGAEAVVEAAAVAANFQRMVRIADSIGIPLDQSNVSFTADIRGQLDLGRFHSAKNSGLDT